MQEANFSADAVASESSLTTGNYEQLCYSTREQVRRFQRSNSKAQSACRVLQFMYVLITSQEIACFSYDHDHVFHLDERSLRYYHPPNLGADLSQGFDNFQQLDDTADDHLDSLLKTIMDLEQRTGTKCTADVVTWR